MIFIRIEESKSLKHAHKFEKSAFCTVVFASRCAPTSEVDEIDIGDLIKADCIGWRILLYTTDHVSGKSGRKGDCTDNQAPECLLGSKTPASSSITLTTLPSHDSVGESLESMPSGS